MLLLATAASAAVDCDAVPAGGSWVSIDCRLASLLVAVDAATALGALQAKVRSRLAKAADRHAQAAAACAQPKLGRARKGLGQVMKAVKQARKTIRRVRAVPDEPRAALLAVLDGLATDLRTLRASATCERQSVSGLRPRGVSAHDPAGVGTFWRFGDR